MKAEYLDRAERVVVGLNKVEEDRKALKAQPLQRVSAWTGGGVQVVYNGGPAMAEIKKAMLAGLDDLEARYRHEAAQIGLIL